MKQEPVIVVKDLVKKFGDFKALNKLDLTVNKGEVHGFLGPNGSGKSTTIRVLLGLLKKNSGDVSLLGGDPWKDAVKLHKQLAYVPGDVSLWPNLTGGEAIDLLGTLRGGIDKKRRAELIKRFNIEPAKKFRTYSKGNRQKIAIVAALASDVDLYILDEPTSGLDPLMEAVFQKTIDELKNQGKTILLSSHILAEVEKLCDKVTIIREGKTVQSGTLQELRHLTNTSVRVDTKEKVTGLQKAVKVHGLKTDGNHLEFEVASDDLSKTMAHLAKFNIVNLVSQPPSLEELFMRHYNKQPASKKKQEKAA
jgi:ABC-2 type transport system ATP-binding protein